MTLLSVDLSDFPKSAAASRNQSPTTGAETPLDRALVAEGADENMSALARSIYMQESGGGKNTTTSNAGARGGMQIIPATFARVADKGWDINDPDLNARAGVRYLQKLDRLAGGDAYLTAAGYYGGEGGLARARRNVPSFDKLNPDAPNTLQYAQQVVDRIPGYLAQNNRVFTRVAAPVAAAVANPFVGNPTNNLAPVPKDRPASASVMDYIKEIGASAVDSVGSIGQLVGEGAAYVANQAGDTEKYESKNILKPVSTAIRGTMTEGGKAAAEQANVEGSVVDLFTGDAKLPETVDGYLMMGANGFGSVLTMLVPGIGLASKAGAAAKLAAEANALAKATGLAADVAKAAELTKAASAASLVSKGSGAALGGLTTGGAAAGEVRESADKAISSQSHEQLLAGVPVYAEIFNRTGDQEQARQGTVNAAARYAGGAAAVFGAVGGAFNSKVLEDFILRKGLAQIAGNSAKSTLGRGAISGAGFGLLEGGQEVSEKVGQNFGENIALGKDATDNVLRNTAGDFVGGALVGGPLGVVGGARSKPPAAAKTDPLVDAKIQRDAVLAPLAQRITDQPVNSTLSKATLAGNTGAAADAELVTQVSQNAQPATLLNSEAADRLRELQAITQGTPDQTSPITGTVSGTPGRLLSAAEQTEFKLLSGLQADSEQAANSADLKSRTESIVGQAKGGTIFTALRMPGSPVSVRDFVGDLSIAQSPSVPKPAREKALGRLQIALDWAGANPAPLATPVLQQSVAGATPGIAAPATLADKQVAVDAAAYSPSEIAAANATQAAANDAANAVGTAGVGSQSNVSEKTPVLLTNGQAADAVTDVVARAPSARVMVDMDEPMVTAPAGPGPAVFRKRKLALTSIAESGLTTVERRNDGAFFMVDGTRKRQYKLSGPADAQLARKAVQDYANGQAKAGTAIVTPATPATNPTTPIGAINGNTGSSAGVSTDSRINAGDDPSAGVDAGRTGSGVRAGEPTDANTAVPGVGSGAAVAAGTASPATGYVTINDSKGVRRNIELVSPAGESSSNRRPGNGRLISKKNAALVSKMAAVFGKKIEFYRDATLGDGFVIDSRPGTIFLNEFSSVQPLAVFGHELLHQIGREMPAVHAAIVKVVTANMTPDAANKFRDNYHGAEAGPNSNNVLSEGDINELTSDLGGNLMSDPAFWGEVFAQIQADNPTTAKALIAKLADYIAKLLSKATKLIGQGQFMAPELMKDMTEVRQAFREGLAKYTSANGISQASMQGEILKAGQNARLSPVRRNDLLAAKMGSINIKNTDDFWKSWANFMLGTAGPDPRLSMMGSSQTTAQRVKAQVGFHAQEAQRFGLLGVLKQYGGKPEEKADGAGADGMVSAAMAKKILISAGISPTVENAVAAYDSLAGSEPAANQSTKGIQPRAQSAVGKIPFEGFEYKFNKSPASNQDSLLNDQPDPKNTDITRSPARDNAADATQNPVPQTDRNDSSARLGQAASADAGSAPEYGQARTGAVSVLARHYSDQPRSSLSGAAWGRGLKGAERGRLEGADPRLSKRIYFYVDNGSGIRPESGVGAFAHEVRLNNIYNPATKLVTYKGGANEFEAAVLDAGFDGYMAPSTRTQGAVVLLGSQHRNVPVQQIGQPQNAALPEDAKPTSKVEVLMSKELNRIDMAAIPGAALRNGTLTVPEGAFRAANAEMARIDSTIRFSPARAADAPASEYDQVVAKFKGTDGWLKAPNGNATKLNERQWVHVRTPAFAKWFGDWTAFAGIPGGVWNDSDGQVSKAVDANGEPLVVYHGADAGGFSTFNTPGGQRRGDVGIYTSNNWYTAASYVTRGRAKTLQEADVGGFNDDVALWWNDEGGANQETPFADLTPAQAADARATYRDEVDSYADKTPGVYALFVNLRNPGEDDFEGAIWNGDREDQFSVNVTTKEEQFTNREGRQIFSREEADTIAEANDGEVVPAQNHFGTTDDAVREARSNQNDGAIIRQVIDDGPGGVGRNDVADLFVAFDPQQLKSADFNDGEYAIDKDDIRMSPKRRVGEKIASAMAKRLKLSGAEIASTNLAMQTGLPKGEAFDNPKIGKIPAVIQYLEERRLASGLPVLSLSQEADRETLAKLLTAEALAAIESAGSALEWYDATINTTLARMSLKFPELKDEPRARTAFVLIMAVTSQGLNVENNLGATIRLYGEYRADQRFPERGEGESAAVMAGNFKLLNKLQDEMKPDLMARFLKTPFTVGELERSGFKVGGELVDEQVLGSSVLGPKIGFGFFSNLTGNFDPVTMDMWFMRTIGRLMGTVRAFDSKLFAKQTAGFMKSLEEKGDNGIYALDLDPAMVYAATTPVANEDGVMQANEDAIVALAREVNRRHQREFIKRRAEFDSGARQKSALVLASGNIVRSMDKPKDAPASGGERRLLRDVVKRTVEKVSKAYKRKVPAAALQALIWYPEQELYKSLGVQLAVTSQDYAGAALKILKEDGIDEQQLLAAGKPGSGTVQPAGVGQDGPANPNSGAKLGRIDALQGREREQFLAGRRQQEVIRQEQDRPSRSQVVFEVAPSPADKRLTAAWQALDSATRLRISQSVVAKIVPQVLKAYGVDAVSVEQIGSYLDDTNPSFALILDQPKHTLAITKELGFVLSQASMLAVSPIPFPGGVTTGVVSVKVGEQNTVQIDRIYQQLRGIKNGDRLAVSGQTTGNGRMLVLNESGMSNADLALEINQALESKYNVTSGEAFTALLQQPEYDYANSENDPRGVRGGDRRRARDLRSEASAELRKQLRAEAANNVKQSTGRTNAQPVSEPGSVRGVDGVLAGTRRPYQGDGRQGTSLAGLPTRIEVDGKQVVFAGFKPAQDAAADYMQEAGFAYDPPKAYIKVDPAQARQIAAAFEAMPNDPTNPQVKAAYKAMIQETLDQYQTILKTGLKVEFNDGSDPYGNPRNAILDVVENNHLFIFSTKDGFGSSDMDVSANPMLAETEFMFGDQPALANDVFRVVHDYFGHIKEGVGFRSDGEENAWRSHSAMYSPLARKAMTTETRGQNNTVNYGKNGEFNRTANGADTIYADQKVGLLPDWIVNDGAQDASVQGENSLASTQTSDIMPQQKVARSEALVALRKRKTMLEKIKKCLG